MNDPVPYRAPAAGSQPPLDSPAYGSTHKRHPKHPPISIPTSLTEASAPHFDPAFYPPETDMSLVDGRAASCGERGIELRQDHIEVSAGIVRRQTVPQIVGEGQFAGGNDFRIAKPDIENTVEIEHGLGMLGSGRRQRQIRPMRIHPLTRKLQNPTSSPTHLGNMTEMSQMPENHGEAPSGKVRKA